MEPFSIACTTCQARLRVRDKSVIGQILTCPKCGSMVLVELPSATGIASATPADQSEGTSPTHETAPSARVAATHANFEDAASLFDEPSPPAAPASPDLIDTVEDLSVQAESRRAIRKEDIDSKVGSWKSEPVADDEPDEIATSESSPPPLPVSDEVLLPSADWTPASTVRLRNRVLTGMAAVIGVILAVMLLIAFGGGGESPTIASIPITPTSKTPSIGDEVPDQAHALDQEDRTEVEIADPDPAATAREAAMDDFSQPPLEGPAETPAADTINPAPAPSDVEPMPSDPPTDEPPGLTPKETNTDPAAADGTPSPLADTLREFGELLEKPDVPVASPMPEVSVELPPAPEAGETEAEPVARRTGPRVVELADRLNDPVAQIEFDGVPLANFLRFVSDYSTIPITLDADALRWARISPITAVKLNATDTTVAEVLKQGLAPLGLEHRIESDQLFVTRRPKDETGMRTVTFKIEDLVGNDAEQLQQLVTHIMDFAAPESWSSRGGIGTITTRGSELIIEQSETAQFEILEFCEKLRVARGLKTRSRSYDPAMFRLESRGERARAKLAQPITLTYIRPAPLQRIVDRIVKEAKLHILIDWRALAEAEWSPDAEVRFSVADQPVATALSMLLEPLDLAYRVVDESTLQITTPAVLDSRLEIELYRVAKPEDDGAALVQSAREALGTANFRDGGGSGQLAFDKPSNCLLVCLSQPLQTELQAWLATQPAPAADAASAENATPAATVGSRIVPASGRASND